MFDHLVTAMRTPNSAMVAERRPKSKAPTVFAKIMQVSIGLEKQAKVEMGGAREEQANTRYYIARCLV